MIKRRSLLAGAGLGLWTQAARSASTLVDEVWHDPARQRDVPALLRVPATPGPWPVLLYSHGLGGSRHGGDAWGQAWVDAGFLVIHLQHAGSDSAAIRTGLRAAANVEQLVARVHDVRFAVDEVARRHGAAKAPAQSASASAAAASPGLVPWANVLPASIGLAGHSFGAQTAQSVAGQRYAVPADFIEPRLQAFIALSPSSHRAGLSPQQQFGAITRPFFGITGSLDGDPFGSYSTGDSRALLYEGLPPGQRAQLWLDGADHMSFAGNAQRRINGAGPFRRADVANEREPAHHAVVARLTTLWWRAQLMGDEVARAALVRPTGLGERDRWNFG